MPYAHILGTPHTDNTKHVLRIKRLIWVCFWFWIFEGALRKWVLPFLANPLLLVRDPFVIYIYCIALRHGLFPRNLIITMTMVLGVISLFAGLLVLPEAIAVVLYGFRTNFLFIPLIFIIGCTLDRNDVYKIGFWILVVSIPMALLMTAQFRSPPSAWINAGEEEAFKQIGSAMGHIRAPGTFSYILGPVYFYSLVIVFQIDAVFSGRKYPKWLITMSMIALGLAMVVSGSRSLVASVGVVFVFALIIGFVLIPRLTFRTFQLLGVIVVLGTILSQIDAFQEGFEVLNERTQNAAKTEGGAQGFVSRFLADFVITPEMLFDVPLWGNGIGLGTNVGAVLQTGKRMFLLAENEWARVMLENGPILGLSFLMLRIWIFAWLCRCSIQQAIEDNTLPFLLMGACGLSVIIGNWGIATILGFSTFASGLALAAMHNRFDEWPPSKLLEEISS